MTPKSAHDTILKKKSLTLLTFHGHTFEGRHGQFFSFFKPLDRIFYKCFEICHGHILEKNYVHFTEVTGAFSKNTTV